MAEQSLQVQGQILVVDDDHDLREFLKAFLTSSGHSVHVCSSGAEALSFLSSTDPNTGDPVVVDLILSDVNMPEMSGITLLKELKKIRSEIPVVMISAHANVEHAVEAMKVGAHDYLTKPLKPADVTATVNRTLKFRCLEKENSLLRREIQKTWTLGEMIGKSPQMQTVFDLIRRVSKVTANVLILGESGTGKEMVARAIHQHSPRAKKPFVAINCAAIPEQLLESELFGHAKGSFTGAIGSKRGLLEEAEGGTVFLDEIGDMGIALQAKLLRVIQERKVRPVGQNTFKSIDVRIVAATHRDLKKAIAAGTFREDLYYRLSVVPIHITPLRERTEEIPLFAEYFLKKFAAKHGRSLSGFTKSAMMRLISSPWEGNVRQLENAIERAVILCDESMIDESHIFFITESEGAGEASFQAEDPLNIQEMEKVLLENALKKTGGRKGEAAKILGISRKTLYRKEKEFGLGTHH